MASDSDPGPDDQIPDIDTGAILSMKVERTVFAFSYSVMLVVASCNVYNYLFKKEMYKSYPMTMAYTILIIYSTLSIGYELFMSIACGQHDCASTIYAYYASIGGS